jgi:hypothetical protein
MALYTELTVPLGSVAVVIDTGIGDGAMVSV